MFSGLKKFVGVFVALAVVSLVGSAMGMALIYDITEYGGYRPNLFWVYLIIVFVPLLFALAAVAMKKIILEMEIAAQANLQNMKMIEKRLQKLEAKTDNVK